MTFTTSGTRRHRVGVLAFAGISPFHLAVPSLVLASSALTRHGAPYEVVTCALTPGPLATDAGYDVVVHHGLETLAGSQTVVVPSWDPDVPPPGALLDALRAAHERGARVVGLCLGAFPVAASGIVDGREVATHWSAAAALAALYPTVRVRSDLLWADHGDVLTSAGVAAALDCCLHMVRSDLGARAAADVARTIVLAPHRDGSQAQYIPAPVARAGADDPIDAAMAWALDRLDTSLDLDGWSARTAMSRRTFTRRFHDRTGTSPGAWLLDQRLVRAKLLLETTSDTVDAVARAVGFSTAASLRMHFTTRFGTSPSRHRRAFA
jgi:transcriptional regulator GlxA family with amidase domain